MQILGFFLRFLENRAPDTEGSPLIWATLHQLGQSFTPMCLCHQAV